MELLRCQLEPPHDPEFDVGLTREPPALFEVLSKAAVLDWEQGSILASRSGEQTWLRFLAGFSVDALKMSRSAERATDCSRAAGPEAGLSVNAVDQHNHRRRYSRSEAHIAVNITQSSRLRC
jgi:hypothetical protein